METIEPNGQNQENAGVGIPPESVQGARNDKAHAYIDIDKDGWLTAKIHLSKGLYEIIGFLAQLEDNVRVFYTRQIKAQQKELVKPGFRGYNPFKRG